MSTESDTSASFYKVSMRNSEALPGVWGNWVIRSFIYGEQANKSLKLNGTGVQGNKGNLGEQGT